MIRFLVSTAIHLAANAIGLLIAAWVLADMTLAAGPFIFVVLVFTAIEVVAGPLIVKIAHKNAPGLLGAIALVVTFVGLVLTDAIADGLDIEGVPTWIGATVIVWIGALLAGWLLPIVLVKAGIEHRKDAAQGSTRTFSP